MRSQRVDVDDGPMSRFSSEFRRVLVCRYGRLPSAPFVAREFNLRHRGSRTISSESVRRWLQGDCLPHIDRLQTISDWLDIRMDSVFAPYQGGPLPRGAGHSSGLSHIVADYRLQDMPAATESAPLSEEQRTSLRRLLMNLYPELNLEAFEQSVPRGPVQGLLFP
jgi:transcriptional regulator with XRE-family HTH domain